MVLPEREIEGLSAFSDGFFSGLRICASGDALESGELDEIGKRANGAERLGDSPLNLGARRNGFFGLANARESPNLPHLYRTNDGPSARKRGV